MNKVHNEKIELAHRIADAISSVNPYRGNAWSPRRTGGQPNGPVRVYVTRGTNSGKTIDFGFIEITESGPESHLTGTSYDRSQIWNAAKSA